jgi:hypothetical protein
MHDLEHGKKKNPSYEWGLRRRYHDMSVINLSKTDVLTEVTGKTDFGLAEMGANMVYRSFQNETKALELRYMVMAQHENLVLASDNTQQYSRQK